MDITNWYRPEEPFTIVQANRPVLQYHGIREASQIEATVSSIRIIQGGDPDALGRFCWDVTDWCDPLQPFTVLHENQLVLQYPGVDNAFPIEAASPGNPWLEPLTCPPDNDPGSEESFSSPGDSDSPTALDLLGTLSSSSPSSGTFTPQNSPPDPPPSTSSHSARPTPKPTRNQRRRQKRVGCDVAGCGQTFASRKEHRRHVQDIHQKLAAICPRCAKELSARPDNLRRHLRTACGQRHLHPCDRDTLEQLVARAEQVRRAAPVGCGRLTSAG